MKTLKQMLRQPLKYFAGVVLLTLAVAVLCVCLGQALAAKTTKADLDRQFSTVGIITDYTDSDRVEQELLDWLEETALEHPDVLKDVSCQGILSAYIPELLPRYINGATGHSTITVINGAIYFGNAVFSGYKTVRQTMPYDCAMLVITLEEVSQPEAIIEKFDPNGENLTEDDFEFIQEYLEYQETTQWTEVITGYSIKLVGTVTQVLSLHESAQSPEGMIARLSLTLPTLEQIEDLNLVPGEQYIVYGMDYINQYQNLVSSLKIKYSHVELEPFDPSLLDIFTPEEVDAYAKRIGREGVVALYNYVPLYQNMLDQLNAITMTLMSPISTTAYNDIRDQAEILQQLIPKTEVTYYDADGISYTLSNEEYIARYEIPTIAKLDGSVEDFLLSEAGKTWQAALQRDKINNHAFTVLGVTRMNHVATFSMGRSVITEGRDFTKEEEEKGGRVCIVHESIAHQSGLQLGDTITLNLYNTDCGLPYEVSRTEGGNMIRPKASIYFDTTPFVETEEYTIVGFWADGKGASSIDSNLYDFTTNTVFVPQTSVQVPMQMANGINFITAVLENGQIHQFHDLVKGAGFAGRLRYSDQNYSKIATNFHNYEDLARQILTIGLVLYVVLMLLFLLLYPASQRKTVWTMQSLGCTYLRRFGYVLLSSMSIVVPATALGGLVGYSLWEWVVAALQATAESSIVLRLDPGALAQIAAAQLVLALIFNVLVAVLVAAPRSIASRR